MFHMCKRHTICLMMSWCICLPAHAYIDNSYTEKGFLVAEILSATQSLQAQQLYIFPDLITCSKYQRKKLTQVVLYLWT